jgi:hypothetical protein
MFHVKIRSHLVLQYSILILSSPSISYLVRITWRWGNWPKHVVKYTQPLLTVKRFSPWVPDYVNTFHVLTQRDVYTKGQWRNAPCVVARQQTLEECKNANTSPNNIKMKILSTAGVHKVCFADPKGSSTSSQRIRGYTSVMATLKFGVLLEIIAEPL